MTEDFLTTFKNHLEKYLNGETPYNYFKKLKKIIKEGTKERLFRTNPSVDIQNKKNECNVKDVLSFEDIRKLSATKCNNEQVRRAFLFSYLTGLRYCDVKALKWKNIKGGG